MRRFFAFCWIYALVIFGLHLFFGDWPWLTRNAEATGTTYYISYSTGSNSNIGTSQGSPWKSAPGMQQGAGCAGATHSYTATVGDKFLFRGGDTWPAACSEYLFAFSGASGIQDYVGVCISNADYVALGYKGTNDSPCATGASWPSTSWTRPIWDGQFTAPTGGEKMFEVPSANGYVTLDNIEVVHYLATNDLSGCAQASISGTTDGAGNFSTNFIVENVYNHDWGFLGSAMGTLPYNPSTWGVSSDHNLGSICAVTLALNDTEDDLNGEIVGSGGKYYPGGGSIPAGTVFQMGACFKNNIEVSGGICHDVADGNAGYLGRGTHDTEYYHINHSPQDTISGTHSNVIEDLGTLGANGGGIYNNLIFDSTAQETISACYNDPIYNNVIWNGQGSVINITNPNSTACLSNPSAATAYVLNNTIDCRSAAHCIGYYATMGVMYLENNHMITDQANGAAIDNAGCAFGCPTTSHINTNVIQPTAQAAAQGYNIAGKYAPVSSGGITVTTAGTAITSFCSITPLSALCSDASGTAWFGGSFKARTDPPNIGAYVWQGGTTGPPTSIITSPSPGNVSGIVTLTATATPQSPATIANVQFFVNGATFGSPITVPPYTTTLDSTKLANGTNNFSIYAVATDSTSQTGTSSAVSVSVNNSIPGCTVSDSRAVASQGITNQTSTFTATWIEVPNSAANDTVFGLSPAAALTYSNMSALLLADNSGVWKAWNGSGYAAVNSAPYTTGTAYTFSGTFTFSAGALLNYSISETSPSSIVIATNYTPRAAATGLAFWNLISDQTLYDTVKMCNFQVGGGTSLSFSPTSLNFGNVTVSANTTLTISVTSTGGSTTFSSVGITGSSDLTINSNGCTGSQTSCSTVIKFAPSSTGLKTATVTYTDSATGSPHSYAVSGTGIAAASSATPSPTSINFGNVQLGHPSTSGPVTMTLANGPISFDSTPVTFDNPIFSVASSTCVGSVSAPTCSITPQVTPAVLGTVIATMTIHDNSPSPGSTQTVSLIVTAVNFPTVAPAVNFVFSPSFPITVTLGKKTYAETYAASCSCQWANQAWGCSCQ